VAQLYVSHPGVVGAPLRALAGFQRVHLNPGQKMNVTFVLTPRDISLVDKDGHRAIVPGKLDLWIGGGQPISTPSVAKPAGVSVPFSVPGAAALPD